MISFSSSEPSENCVCQARTQASRDSTKDSKSIQYTWATRSSYAHPAFALAASKMPLCPSVVAGGIDPLPAQVPSGLRSYRLMRLGSYGLVSPWNTFRRLRRCLRSLFLGSMHETACVMI
jgi:hypothetical protein